MGFFDVFRKPTKKEVNRERTEKIRQQGKDGESQVKTKWQLRGYEVERTGRGHDFYVRKRDLLTGKVTDSKYVEAKNGENAKLSPLQKKMKKKYGSRYVEDRVEPSLFGRVFSNVSDFGSSKPKKSTRSNYDSLWGTGSSSKPKKSTRSNYDSLWGTGSSSKPKKSTRSSYDSFFGSSSSKKSKSKRKSDSIW